MRSRAIIHVAGQQRAGKTAFIEALTGGIGVPVVVARCVRDETLRDSRETRPRSHRELGRYRAAGAAEVALFAFPDSDLDYDAFFMTQLMEAWVREQLPPTTGSRLLHGDLLGQNLRTSLDGEQVGVIDWAEALLGDPAYDLAIVTRGKRKPFATSGGLERLLEAYHDLAAFPLLMRDVHFRR